MTRWENLGADRTVETLERYLDLAGDAWADVDLRSREDRLELFLGVRLWRLGGGKLNA